VKVSDYIADFLAKAGVKHVFAVQGGAIAHVIDSVDKRDDMEIVCVGHEQGGAMAVHGYVTGDRRYGCAVATTGPGMINLVNGIASLYYDSLPGMFIGGQVTTGRFRAQELGVRQFGFQESPHADLARPVVKYAATVTRAADIRFEMEKAYHLSLAGRPGPVFLEVCDDVQREDIDPSKLRGFTPEPARLAELSSDVERVFAMIRKAERPILIMGNGIRVAGSAGRAQEFAEMLDIPVALTWGGRDFLPCDHRLNVGPFGMHATRHGNFAVQNSDLVLAVGVRFTQHQTGTPASLFARDAQKIAVDVDEAEIAKCPKMGMPLALGIHSDAGKFIAAALNLRNRYSAPDTKAWQSRIAEWRGHYPIADNAEKKFSQGINPYRAMLALSKAAGPGDIVFGDVGATLSWMFQAWETKPGQSLLTSFNNHSMGYALPASIGAALASPGRSVWSLNGDGGVLMNIQELGMIARHKLPIRTVIFNNHGYGVIQQTQEDYLDSHYAASRADSGLIDADFAKVAEGFGVPAIRIAKPQDLDAGIAEAVRRRGPVLIEIEIAPDARIWPTTRTGRPIEESAPAMTAEELRRNMIVEPAA
jgi:acetolactate synthase-1/2/3 large subunit